MPTPGPGEILTLLITAVLPIAAVLFAIYVVVRLAVRHGLRDRGQQDR